MFPVINLAAGKWGPYSNNQYNRCLRQVKNGWMMDGWKIDGWIEDRWVDERKMDGWRERRKMDRWKMDERKEDGWMHCYFLIHTPI